MEQFKRAQVIMLPTENKTYIGKFLENEPYLALYSWYLKSLNIKEQRQGQHLYIISDDEIKEGDWCLNENNNIFQYIGGLLLPTDKKIIATTDTSLKYFIDSKGNKSEHELTKNGYIEFLPQPSQQFIEKYIESYNKGNIITDVLVEYELLGHEEIPSELWEERYKVNPKDNTITIKKVKDSYSKTEIIELFKKHNIDICKKYHISYIQEFTDKWLDKNL